MYYVVKIKRTKLKPKIQQLIKQAMIELQGMAE